MIILDGKLLQWKKLQKKHLAAYKHTGLEMHGYDKRQKILQNFKTKNYHGFKKLKKFYKNKKVLITGNTGLKVCGYF